MFHNKYYHYIQYLFFFIFVNFISSISIIPVLTPKIGQFLECDSCLGKTSQICSDSWIFFCISVKLDIALIVFYLVNLILLLIFNYKLAYFYIFKCLLLTIFIVLVRFIPILGLQIFYYVSLIGGLFFSLLNASLLIDGIMHFCLILSESQIKTIMTLSVFGTLVMTILGLIIEYSLLNLLINVSNLLLSSIILITGKIKYNLTAAITLICYNSYIVFTTILANKYELNNIISIIQNILNIILIIWSIISIANSHNFISCIISYWRNESSSDHVSFYHKYEEKLVDSNLNNLYPDVELEEYFLNHMKQILIFLFILILATCFITNNNYEESLVNMDFRLWSRLSSVLINSVLFVFIHKFVNRVSDVKLGNDV